MKEYCDLNPIPNIGNSRFYTEFNVGSMLPQTELSGNTVSKDSIVDDDYDTDEDIFDYKGGNDVNIVDKMMESFFGESCKDTQDNIVDGLMKTFFKESSNSKVPKEIAPIVKILEDKGYQVKYASPGYPETRFKNDRNKDGIINAKMVNTARIIFSREYKFKKTPQGWYWKPIDTKTSDCKSLYVKPRTYNEKMGSKEEAAKKWRLFYLESLRSWATELPKCGESDKQETGPDTNFN